MKIKEYILITIIILFLSSTVYYYIQNETYKKLYNKTITEYTDYKNTQTINYNKIETAYKKITLKYNDQVIKAEENANKAKKELDIITGDNKLLLDKLHTKITSTSNSTMSYNPQPTNTDLRTTFEEPFKQCTTELVELARIADNYVIDIKKLKESWPKQETASSEVSGIDHNNE